jgi:nitroimidazol reductase NimA-like FMN-containing flavoprotein (pyridoxamine 5'-phosphate oxidase superfamily)
MLEWMNGIQSLQDGPRRGEMLEKMRALLRENSMCVLATCLDNRTHCSLMTYVTDQEGTTLHTVTLKTSRKYRNMVQNPHVSLLVDSRVDDRSERGRIKALTVFGVSSFVRDEKNRDLILTRIRQEHPHLSELLSHPDAEVIAIHAESFLLLEGPTQAHFVEIKKQG